MVNIKYIWFLVAMSMFFYSCSGMRSVRNMKYLQTESQKNHNEPEVISDFEKLISNKKNTEIKSSNNDEIINPPTQNKSSENYEKLANIVGSRLPTLREQMDLLQNVQDSMKDDISNIKKEINDIKHLLGDIKGTVEDYFPENQKLPLTGKTKEQAELKTKKLESDQNVSKSSADLQSVQNRAISETFLKSDESIGSKKISTKKNISKLSNKSVNPKSEPGVEAPKNEDLIVNDKFIEGKNLYTQKKYLEAINSLSESLGNTTSKKQEAEAQYLIGEAYYFLNDYGKSLEYLNKVLNLSVNSSSFQDAARIRKAELNLKTGKLNEAKNDYQLLIRNHPTSSYVPQARKMLQQL